MRTNIFENRDVRTYDETLPGWKSLWEDEDDYESVHEDHE